MPMFTYKASDADGAITDGKYLAQDRAGVLKHLEQIGLIPIAISEFGTQSKGALDRQLSLAIFERITPLDRMVILRNMAAAVKSGLDILQAIDILTFDATKQKVRNLLDGVKAGMQNGQLLSDAFAAQKNLFTPVVIGMLRAGEASGKLGYTLDEINNNLSREYSLKQKVQSAFAYPALLLAASFGVVTLLLGFVLPRLERLFQASQVELPLLTRILVNISHAVTWSPLLDVLVVVFLSILVVYSLKDPHMRLRVLGFFMRVPIINEVLKKIALVRFTRTLGYMIASGTSITEALRLTADAVGNPAYALAIADAAKQLTVGIPFSQTFEKYPDLFPKFLVSLVAVGEKTGTLETVLKTFAAFYEEETEVALKGLTGVIEPLLLLIMGIIVGSVALSILLPIYQLVGQYA